MAEEKPHEATPTKLRKARKEGNVSKSTELNTAFSFVAGAFTALSLIPNFVPILLNWFRSAAYGYPVSYLPIAMIFMYCLIPMVVVGLVTALLTIIQTKGFVPKPLKFELNKLNPAQGFKKMFSKEGVVNAARAFIGFIIGIYAVKPILTEVFDRGIQVPNVIALAVIAQSAIVRIIGVTFGLGLVFGGVDFFLSLQRWKKQLKMTHEEVKRDYKENNGDPLIKGKRRQFHRQLLRGSPNRVRDASVVVTNPTHFAVALEYDPPRIPVPRVLCRAADEMALEVRKLAGYHGVPMVENVPLARELFARAQVGKEIPEDTFVAVAEIVAALIKNTKDGKIPRNPVAAGLG